MSNKLFYTIVLASVFVVVLIHLTQADISEKPVTEVCLGCICDAISGCNQTAYCGGGVCGLFRITWAYWADGGKLTINNEDSASESEKPVTDVCLGCICDAVSGCNQTNACAGGVCGLFHMTWAFWADGGKLVANNTDPASENAYPNCANDPFCAAETIQNYMRKYSQDCNGDNVVDCYDYAAIHKLGAYGCKGVLPAQYSNRLSSCLSNFAGR